MPRVYKRKYTSGSWDPLLMKEAILATASGMACQTAAKVFGLPKASVARYGKIYRSLPEEEKLKFSFSAYYGQWGTVFDKETETVLEDFLIAVSLVVELTNTKCRELAWMFAKENDLPCPASWDPCQRAGKDWLMGFLARHKAVPVRKTRERSQEVIAAMRARGQVSIDVSAVRALLESGSSLQHVAMELGYSSRTLRRHLKKAGVSKNSCLVQDSEIEEIIRENPTWGRRRIHKHFLSEGKKVTENKVRAVLQKVNPVEPVPTNPTDPEDRNGNDEGSSEFNVGLRSKTVQLKQKRRLEDFCPDSAIRDVVRENPTWGRRRVISYFHDEGMNVSESRVRAALNQVSKEFQKTPGATGKNDPRIGTPKLRPRREQRSDPEEDVTVDSGSTSSDSSELDDDFQPSDEEESAEESEDSIVSSINRSPDMGHHKPDPGGFNVAHAALDIPGNMYGLKSEGPAFDPIQCLQKYKPAVKSIKERVEKKNALKEAAANAPASSSGASSVSGVEANEASSVAVPTLEYMDSGTKLDRGKDHKPLIESRHITNKSMNSKAYTRVQSVKPCEVGVALEFRSSGGSTRLDGCVDSGAHVSTKRKARDAHVTFSKRVQSVKPCEDGVALELRSGTGGSTRLDGDVDSGAHVSTKRKARYALENRSEAICVTRLDSSVDSVASVSAKRKAGDALGHHSEASCSTRLDVSVDPGVRVSRTRIKARDCINMDFVPRGKSDVSPEFVDDVLLLWNASSSSDVKVHKIPNSRAYVPVRVSCSERDNSQVRVYKRKNSHEHSGAISTPSYENGVAPELPGVVPNALHFVDSSSSTQVIPCTSDGAGAISIKAEDPLDVLASENASTAQSQLRCLLCNSTSSRQSSPRHYFKFPTDEKRAALWWKIVETVSTAVSPEMRSEACAICEIHFRNEQIDKLHLQTRLLPTAIPTLFLTPVARGTGLKGEKQTRFEKARSKGAHTEQILQEPCLRLSVKPSFKTYSRKRKNEEPSLGGGLSYGQPIESGVPTEEELDKNSHLLNPVDFLEVRVKTEPFTTSSDTLMDAGEMPDLSGSCAVNEIEVATVKPEIVVKEEPEEFFGNDVVNFDHF